MCDVTGGFEPWSVGGIGLRWAQEIRRTVRVAIRKHGTILVR